MKRQAIGLILAGILAAVAVGPNAVSGAITITDLFSTGVDNGGALLPDAATDLHYALVSDPLSLGPASYAYANPPGQLQGVYNVYANSWVPDTATSQWIGPTPDVSVQFSPQFDGQYIYQTTFTLPASWTSVNIAGNWATDNGSQIWLNGVFTGITKGSNGYAALDPFTLPGGASFVPGVNVLQFVVDNDPFANNFNPTGLHVQITAASYTTPEASSFTVWSLIGAVGIVVGRRFRKPRALS